MGVRRESFKLGPEGRNPARGVTSQSQNRDPGGQSPGPERSGGPLEIRWPKPSPWGHIEISNRDPGGHSGRKLRSGGSKTRSWAKIDMRFRCGPTGWVSAFGSRISSATGGPWIRGPKSRSCAETKFREPISKAGSQNRHPAPASSSGGANIEIRRSKTRSWAQIEIRGPTSRFKSL